MSLSSIANGLVQKNAVDFLHQAKDKLVYALELADLPGLTLKNVQGPLHGITTRLSVNDGPRGI